MNYRLVGIIFKLSNLVICTGIQGPRGHAQGMCAPIVIILVKLVLELILVGNSELGTRTNSGQTKPRQDKTRTGQGFLRV